MPRPTKVAEFNTRCPNCQGWMEGGDTIALDEPGGEWMHEACAEETPWDEELDDDFDFYG